MCEAVTEGLVAFPTHLPGDGMGYLLAGRGDLFKIPEMPLTILRIQCGKELQGHLIHTIQKADDKAWLEFFAVFFGTLKRASGKRALQ